MPDDPVTVQLERDWQDLVARLAAPAPAAPSGAPSGPPRPTVLLAELEDVRLTWAELRASGLLERYADRYVTPQWTLKDLLAHLASWSTEFHREAEIVARHEAFDYAIPFAVSVFGPSQWNQVEVDKRRNLTLDQILDELDRELRALEDRVLDLPDEALYREATLPYAPTGDPAALSKGSIAQVVMVKCFHDRHHLERIHQFLDAVRTPPPARP